ncbi:MAG: LD-carboxypeptidase, partial [Nitrospinales bacterium]
FKKGIAVLESMKFEVFVPKGLFKRDGYHAGSEIHRAKMVNDLFSNPAINAIICARGGFGAMKILPMLDYTSILQHPKIFIGFSDISALLSALYTRTGLVTFHGPMVTTLSEGTQQTKNAMLSAFSSEKPLQIVPEKGITLRSGYASGPVSGGNLTTLCHLVGTPFEPDYTGHILFLEDRGEAIYRIDRMLTHMRLAGCFDGLAGLLLGSFDNCGTDDDIFKIVGSVFQRYDIPILTGFAIGHGKNNMTVPIGLDATLNTDRKSLLFHGCATRE